MNLFSRQKLTKLFVIVSLFGMIWAARLTFLYFISDHWIGTLGVTTTMMGGMMYLSWKEKLGWYGNAFWGILSSKLSKKYTKGAISFFTMQLFMLAAFSIGMHMGESVFQEEAKTQHDNIISKNPDAFDEGKFEETVKQEFEKNPLQMIAVFLLAVFLVPLMVFANFPEFAGLMANVNIMYGGQLSHLIDIAFIEEIEVMGILIFTRLLQKKNNMSKRIQY